MLGVLEDQRHLLKSEIDQSASPVSDAAVRYMEAESGDGGSEHLDVVL